DDPVYRSNRERFVRATEHLRERDAMPFDVVLYDPRFRLLAKHQGDEATWAGRFKWHQDDQTYGTPTVWVFPADRTLLGPPFFKNVYESEGRKLRYTPRDVGVMIERAMGAEH
ncbi:MAG: hypothetical protein ACYTGC_10695, partial [Planctomycetota bacterium]